MVANKKVIAYVTGTRADFGLMTPVLHAIEKSNKLNLKVYVTGMHLLSKFGKSIKEVKNKFRNAQTITATINSDSPSALSRFAGEYLKLITQRLMKDRPDFVLLLGDRIEVLMTATACLYLGIPTGHLHGGEKSSTNDEVARHAITKLSSLHFPATKKSATRIKAMGEDKWRVKTVGAPALDTILNKQLPSKKKLIQYLGIPSTDQIILVTQHPVSSQWTQAAKQIRVTINAVRTFRLPVVISYPNADAGGRAMIKEINKEKANPLFRIIPNIPYEYFLALERDASVWVGNSSAGMIESPSFGTPVINVGDRQSGRERGSNVIDVKHNNQEIVRAIKKALFNKSFLKVIRLKKNPWGDGKTSSRIVKVLERLRINSDLLNKHINYA